MSIYSFLNSLQDQVNDLTSRNLVFAGNANISNALTSSYLSGTTAISGALVYAGQLSGSAISGTLVYASQLSGSAISGALVYAGQLTASGIYSSKNIELASGVGIDFGLNSNAAGKTSELFNDYEEGTWTPAYSGSTTGGTAVGGTQVGYYTKVGRMVFINCFLSIGSWSTKPTGSIYISGLPFTINSSGFNYGAASATEFNSFATNFITILPKFEANSTVIGLIKTTAAATSQVTFLTGSDLSSATNQIIISGFYWT